jgi:hypothetical protein
MRKEIRHYSLRNIDKKAHHASVKSGAKNRCQYPKLLYLQPSKKEVIEHGGFLMRKRMPINLRQRVVSGRTRFF